MSKRYYWLKLKEDFFEEDTIAWLEEQENGRDYALFYLKLCLKSLKTNGKLIRTVGNMLVPYDIKKLAEITNTEFDTALVAMELLKQVGLVEILDGGEIYLTRLHEMVGSETTKAVSMRRLRDQRRNALPESDVLPKENLGSGNKSGNNVTQVLPECSQSVALEYRDKEIRDREKEKEKEKSIDYLAIVNAYNETCVSLPKVSKLSDQRKKAIRARLNSGYTQDDFITVFQKAQASDFLRGKNDRNWMASFDWLIKDANMAKVMDGKYDNKGGPNNGGHAKPNGQSDGYDWDKIGTWI